MKNTILNVRTKQNLSLEERPDNATSCPALPIRVNTRIETQFGYGPGLISLDKINEGLRSVTTTNTEQQLLLR